MAIRFRAYPFWHFWGADRGMQESRTHTRTHTYIPQTERERERERERVSDVHEKCLQAMLFLSLVLVILWSVFLSSSEEFVDPFKHRIVLPQVALSGYSPKRKPNATDSRHAALLLTFYVGKISAQFCKGSVLRCRGIFNTHKLAHRPSASRFIRRTFVQYRFYTDICGV